MRFIVLIFFSSRYAQRQKSAAGMLAVPMEPRCMNPLSWKGQVGAVLGGDLYHANFAFDISKDPARFDAEILKLAERIKVLVDRA
jgi:hypothetical protein